MSDKDQPVDHGLYPSPNNFEPYTQADIDAAKETHVEWFGSLQVHKPVKESK